jgi:hypothetical protein
MRPAPSDACAAAGLIALGVDIAQNSPEPMRVSARDTNHPLK